MGLYLFLNDANSFSLWLFNIDLKEGQSNKANGESVSFIFTLVTTCSFRLEQFTNVKTIVGDKSMVSRTLDW